VTNQVMKGRQLRVGRAAAPNAPLGKSGRTYDFGGAPAAGEDANGKDR